MVAVKSDINRAVLTVRDLLLASDQTPETDITEATTTRLKQFVTAVRSNASDKVCGAA